MTDEELRTLERAIEEMMEIAHRFGLDFFPMRFEIVPADVLYTFGAYQGMPVHFSHWSYGKAYHRLKLDYDLGLSRIYELVINADPCYAFLLESNSLVQNMLVCAHVLAHSDFFKNNAAFANSSRDIVLRMAASAERFKAYEARYGRDRVESFLDAALALGEHVDPSLRAQRRPRTEKPAAKIESGARASGPYDDLWGLESGRAPNEAQQPGDGSPEPEKDVLLFILTNSTRLEDWERDVLTVVRDEMLYFWPQIETKIMNEGWATFWHQRILRELPLSDAQALDFATTHAAVVAPQRGAINPYLLGVRIWEDLLGRATGGLGDAGCYQRLFDVRLMETDASFVRNHLTQKLVDDLDLYLYRKVGSQWQVVERDWEKVRDGIVAARANGGYPVIHVIDGDYRRAGELYLRHSYEGVELDLRYTERTLPHVERLWGRPVHLETVRDGRPLVFRCDGGQVSRRDAAT